MIDERSEEIERVWQQVARVPPLEGDAVHVWLVRIGTRSHDTGVLSAEERERADRLREPARSRFLATRAALRMRLAAYLGGAAAKLQFRYGEMGKPTLTTPHDVQFSVAHSADVALLAFARVVPVGVDLERVRSVPRHDRIAPRVFAPASAGALAALPERERDEAFIWAWTQREAYVKAIGGGVLRSPDPLPFVWPPRSYERHGWLIAPLIVDARHHACLAVGGTGRSVHLLAEG